MKTITLTLEDCGRIEATSPDRVTVGDLLKTTAILLQIFARESGFGLEGASDAVLAEATRGPIKSA